MKTLCLILLIFFTNTLFPQNDPVIIQEGDIRFDRGGSVKECLDEVVGEPKLDEYIIPVESIVCGFISKENDKFYLLLTSSDPEMTEKDLCYIEFLNYSAWKGFWEYHVYDASKSQDGIDKTDFSLFQICGSGNENRKPAFVNILYFDRVSVYRVKALVHDRIIPESVEINWLFSELACLQCRELGKMREGNGKDKWIMVSNFEPRVSLEITGIPSKEYLFDEQFNFFVKDIIDPDDLHKKNIGEPKKEKPSAPPPSLGWIPFGSF